MCVHETQSNLPTSFKKQTFPYAFLLSLKNVNKKLPCSILQLFSSMILVALTFKALLFQPNTKHT